MHKVYVSREDYFDLSNATRIPPSARHGAALAESCNFVQRDTVFKIGRLSVRRGVSKNEAGGNVHEYKGRG
jgi:hypothetical protein